MRIAIIGAGVSGLVCAHLLHRDHELVIFEASDRAGGHANTVHVETDTGAYNLDTGFVVFNDRNYPGFERLLGELGVATQPSQMSFGVSDGVDFEYNGASPNGLFAARSNMIEPAFHRMIADVIHFNRDARQLLVSKENPSLRDWLSQQRYSRMFVERLIVPQASAVWSAVSSRGCEPERFDAVVIATHSDQALALLADPSERERELLGAIPYQQNEVVLHTDRSLLPRRRRAWASWNFHLDAGSQWRCMVTYHMNRLQSLRADREFCVTLNRTEAIDPEQIIWTMRYAHPVFIPTGVAQAHHDEISGRNRTHYCGAYWGWGFHEDGLSSARRVVGELS